MLSLCMIVKNEEKQLEKAFSSVRHIIDEAIIVDTGSSDQTPDIAKDMGAKVITRPFADDFSEARNVAIREASSPWILFLDADEKILPDEASAIAEAIQRDDAPSGYWLKRYNYLGIGTWRLSSLVRLLRKTSDIYYQGKIWEKVIIPDFDRKTQHLDVNIHHYGECREKTILFEKVRYYLRLCEQEIEQTPKPFLFTLAADRCLILGEIERGLRFCEQGRKLFPDYDWLPYVQGTLASSQGETEKAIDLLKEGMKICSKRKPGNLHFFYNRLGIIYYLNQHPEEAYYCFESAVTENSETAHHCLNLALCAEALGFYEKALAHYQKALTLNKNMEYEHLDYGDDYREMHRYRSDVIPGFQGIFKPMARCCLALGRQDQAHDYKTKDLKIERRKN